MRICRRDAGTSLIETTWALMLTVMILLAAVSFIANSFQVMHHNKDKNFAVQKAIAILEELKGLVERKSGGNINLLDTYDDGANRNPILTTQTGVTDPDHATSGNTLLAGGWRYERQVSVSKIPSLQTNDIRMVSVKVYAHEAPGEESLLAEVSGVIRTIADQYPPSQVYDVYCLAAAQVPGWWVYMANLIPFVQNAISDLQARNPGLEFRTHWIRQLAYGRDAEYTPFVNNSVDSAQDIDWVYFYPGLLPTGSAVNYYYVPAQFRARVSVDGTLANDYDATTNPHPVSLADQYNHALRHPDELALHQQRVAAGLETEPTLRLLLDDMVLNPQNYQNAILINLHGELLPFPPVRNYSDAAKDPTDHPGVRVVTHPERLRYTNSQDVRLRVYSHLTDPSAAGTYLDEPISVLLEGITDSSGITVQSIEGGLDLSPVDGSPDVYAAQVGDTAEDYPGDMHYAIQSVTGGTLIKLYNSALKSPCVMVSGACTSGLPAARRLYALEYIPTPLPAGASDAFARNLTDTGDMTKNTARWVITIPAARFTDNQRWAVETRIGDDLTTGVAFPVWNEPTNRSRTYVWRGSDVWVFGDGGLTNLPHLPVTERYQLIGDPRHSPYADLKETYDAALRPLGGGYNRYFDNFRTSTPSVDATVTAAWPGFTTSGQQIRDGWSGGGSMEVDVNRVMQILREALLKTRALWTTMTGYSYFYLGLGNEIGYDSANGFANSIPVSRKPYDGGSGSRWEQSITTDQTGGVKLVRENVGSGYWWSMHWLGELYPDAEYATWRANGNLPTGTGAGRYVRTLRQNVTERLPSGTQFFGAVRRTAEKGSTAFFSLPTANSTFHHQYRDNTTGALQPDGREIADNYHFPIPDTANISRPFNTNIDNTGWNPTDFLSALYYNGTLSSSVLATYFNHSDATVQGSQLLTLAGAGNDLAYVVVNGLDRTVQNGSAFIGRWSFLTLIHSFLGGGLYGGAGRIVQLPRVKITDPNDMTDLNDPATIDVQWTLEWKRWDGQKYTSNYADGFTESGAISYAVLYSSDSGKTWRYAQDGTAATTGVKPGPGYLVAGTSYTWDVPAGSHPAGSYIVMVEAFQQDRALHYSHHRQKIFIKR